MSFFDFVEIGTSNFDTLIQRANDSHRGVSVEPLSYYLNQLPNRKNVLKLNKGISNKSATRKFFYIPEDLILEFKMPSWLKGCNSIDSYHPTALKICKGLRLNPEEVFLVDEVEVITPLQLIDECHVETIDFLKIDTEGHDLIITNEFIDLIKSKRVVINKIKFETNSCTSIREQDIVIKSLTDLGYKTVQRDRDTVMTL